MAGRLRDGTKARLDREMRRKYCDADTPHGQCHQFAGHGTDTPGWGPCKRHFGNTPSVRRLVNRARTHDMAAEAVQILGIPIKTTPEQALLEEVWRSQGEVVWLESQIQDWETTPDGKVRVRSWDPAAMDHVIHEITVMEAIAKHPVYRAYTNAREHLARVSKLAVDAKLTERALKLEEDKVRVLAGVVNAAILAAGLEPSQQIAVRQALRAQIEQTPELAAG